MTRLTGKIGRAIALRLASDGARVAVHYGNSDQAANEALGEIERAGFASPPMPPLSAPAASRRACEW